MSTAPATSKTTRRWLQVSLRSLLLLQMIAVIGLVSYYRWYERHREKYSRVVATTWDIRSGENVKWSVPLGSQTYSSPVISGGRVFIGSNNANGYLSRYPSDIDLGVLLCFRESDGKFLWQASSPKLAAGRVQDWPMQGITSTALVDANRLWYVTNRCEVVCLDTEGFHDGENDGPFRTEVNTHQDEADIVWVVDMIKQFDVFPHNASTCKVATDGYRLFVVTSNGLDDSHRHLPAPDAPSFVALDRETGMLLWSDNSPGVNIHHGQWGSPTYAVINGVRQVLFPGGDGWLYSFDPAGDGNGKGKLLWKFDGNPKDALLQLGPRGTRNEINNAPVVYNGLVYATLGQDPEHGEGDSVLWCIDPTKRGDVSPELVFNRADPEHPIAHKRIRACEPDLGDFVRPNPNSAVVWSYRGSDLNQNGKLDFDETMHRTVARVAIQDDILVVSDFGGLLHCLDARTGRAHWTHDMLSACWSSPLIAGDHIYVADEDGDVLVFRLSSDPTVAKVLGNPLVETNMGNSVYDMPTAANRVLYVPAKTRLYAIEDVSK